MRWRIVCVVGLLLAGGLAGACGPKVVTVKSEANKMSPQQRAFVAKWKHSQIEGARLPKGKPGVPPRGPNGIHPPGS